MKRLLLSTIGVLSLLGCSTPIDVVTTPQKAEMQQVSDLQNVNWNLVTVPSLFRFEIEASSQVIRNSEIDSAVAGFSFDYNGNPTELKLTSIMSKMDVFVPNLAIFDQNFNHIRTYNSGNFSYDRDDFNVGEAMQGELVLNLGTQVTRVYALVFTTEEALTETTTVIHPAKAFAIAKRVDPPSIPDPIKKHSKYGTVEVALKDLSSGWSGFSREPYYGDKTETVNTVSDVAKPLVAIDTIPETKQYYHSAIKSAVAEDNIPKALSLLDEAKALNIEDAQQVFIQAINAK